MDRYYFLIFCILVFLKLTNLNVSVFAELIHNSNNEEKIEEDEEDEEDEDEEEEEA